MRATIRADALRSFAFVLAVMVSLAGCANPAARPAASDEQHVGVGSLRGQARDDEARPVRGATVALLRHDVATTTDEAGRFGFDNLAPGTYLVAFQAAGYEALVTQAEVASGGIANVDVTLTQIPNLVPFNSTYVFRGRVSCGVAGSSPCAVLSLAPADPLGNANFYNWTYQQRVPDWLILEVEWNPSTALTGKKLSYGLLEWPKDNSGPETIESGNAPSPIYIRVDAARLEATKDEGRGMFEVILWGDRAGVALQQDFTLYRTDFFGEDPPEGWRSVRAQ